MNHKLDPELAAYLKQVQPTLDKAHQLSAVELRDTFDTLRLPPVEAPAVFEVRNITIPAATTDIPARLYKSSDKVLPLLVWFHGGGWVLGDLDGADLTCREMASQSGCHVLSIDYRLAPEHPFPAAYDDAVTSIHYAFEQAAVLGADATNIAVGGDSAGANLATCACIATKALNSKYQLLIYPVIEADFNKKSYTDNAHNYFLTRDLMKFFWDQYIPEASHREDCRVAPVNAELTGLPPTYLLTVQFDPLRDEGLKYANALQAAGVPVVTEHVSDTVHGFFTTPTKSGAEARKKAAARLKSALM